MKKFRYGLAVSVFVLWLMTFIGFAQDYSTPPVPTNPLYALPLWATAAMAVILWWFLRTAHAQNTKLLEAHSRMLHRLDKEIARIEERLNIVPLSPSEEE